MIEHAMTWLVDFIHSLGYLGLFIATCMESMFFPIPSAATMIPAGYLASQGQWNIGVVWLIAMSGTLTGSLLNYWIAYYFGRPFLQRYGTYMFFPPARQTQVDDYFERHGEISIFVARFVPGVRHVISFPAGLAKMHLGKFCLFTALGGGAWMTTLMLVGYFIGDNKELVKEYMPMITLLCIVGVVLIVAYYVWHHRRKKRVVNGAV
jgi:membrane protein DedA with SNARE-associated domain